MSAKLKGYLRLMRPANIVTAISDVLAGIAIGGSAISLTWGMSHQTSLGLLIAEQKAVSTLYPIGLLIIATIGLYGGGVVLNDVFDARLDKKERPERPIPSGLISKQSATWFGIILLIIGILAAALSNTSQVFSTPVIIAITIALAAVVYDKWMKHSKILGPLNMGLCRGLNLLLGMSLISFSIQFYWYVALAPVVYIAAITMISRGEVHGGKRRTLYFAAALYNVVVASILVLAYYTNSLIKTLPVVLLFCIIIFPSLQKAILKPEGPMIGKAVKSGIIGLIAMNAGWAAAFGDIYFAVAILFLLPISFLLSKLFAVT